MFSAFFGHYLLNEKIVTTAQLEKALELQESAYLKLGTVAINAGYMTVEQVEEVHGLQLTCDKRFGELAIESDYLSGEQLDLLLNTQKSEHLLLAQCLVDLDILSFDDFDQLLHKYKEAHALTDTALEELKADNVEAIVQQFLQIQDGPNSDFYRDYITLFIKNQVRFINSHVRIGPMTLIQKTTYRHIICQTIFSDSSNYYTALAGEAGPLTSFASIYADEDFDDLGDYPVDAIGEYLNQNNGLFIVNEADEGIELTMNIQRHIESATLKPSLALYDIPLYFASGEIHLILGEL